MKEEFKAAANFDADSDSRHEKKKESAKEIAKNYQVCNKHDMKFQDKCPICWNHASIKCDRCGYNGLFYWEKSRLQCPQCKTLQIDMEMEREARGSAKTI